MKDLPIVKPLMALLFSRKFILFAVGLLVSGIVALIPALEPVQTPMFTLIGAGMLAGITGITVEDAASKTGLWMQENKLTLDKETLKEDLLELLEGLIAGQPAAEQTVNVTVNDAEANQI